MSPDKLDLPAKRFQDAGLFPRSQFDSLSTVHTEDQTAGLFPVEDGTQDYTLFDIDCQRARQISQIEQGFVVGNDV
jgi:hypothetical protein